MVFTLVVFFIGGDVVTSRPISSWRLMIAHVCKIIYHLHLFEADCLNALDMVLCSLRQEI